jgi:hypothetical protein
MRTVQPTSWADAMHLHLHRSTRPRIPPRRLSPRQAREPDEPEPAITTQSAVEPVECPCRRWRASWWDATVTLPSAQGMACVRSPPSSGRVLTVWPSMGQELQASNLTGDDAPILLCLAASQGHGLRDEEGADSALPGYLARSLNRDDPSRMKKTII